jgi:hypothetical protein
MCYKRKIEVLLLDRDHWDSRATAAEAEVKDLCKIEALVLDRDHRKSRATAAEAEVKDLLKIISRLENLS